MGCFFKEDSNSSALSVLSLSFTSVSVCVWGGGGGRDGRCACLSPQPAPHHMVLQHGMAGAQVSTAGTGGSVTVSLSTLCVVLLFAAGKKFLPCP